MATCAFVLFGILRTAVALPTSRPADSEAPLGDTSTYGGIKAVVMSNDGRHLAFLGIDGDKQYVVVDGHQSAAYDWVIPDSLLTLANGKAAYLVQNNDAMQACVAGRLDKPYPSIAFNRLFLSLDGQKVVYVAVLPSKKMAIVMDGQEGPAFDAIDFPLFSPDGNHLAYRATDANRARIIVDGQPQAEYDTVVGISLSFSPDSQRIGYEAVRKDQHFIVIDGKEVMPCHPLRAGPGFSPDSKRWAAAVAADSGDSKDGKTQMAVDGKLGPTYDAVYAGDIRFSPDSKHFAFAARQNDQSFVVLDGAKTTEVDDIGSHTLLFSPDSQHVAFAAMAGHDQLVVSDSKLLKGWQAIQVGTPLYSPDSKHLAYAAQQDNKWVEVFDTKESPLWDLAGAPIFSPDSNHTAYRTLTGKLAQAVIDGVPSAPYFGVGPISFGPDSRHTIYVSKSDSISRICVDGIPSVAEYDLHTPDQPAIFDDANTAHVISLRKGKFLLVTVKIPAK